MNQLNRRDFLKTLGIGAGAALISAEVVEALAAPDLPVTLARAAQTSDPVAHVLNRVTFGPRPGQVNAVRQMGLQTYLEQQLKPQSINDDASEQRLGGYITLDMTPVEMLAMGNDQAEIIAELDSATIMRSTYSERQLFEIMVNFWSAHFSLCHINETRNILTTPDEPDVILNYAPVKYR